MALRISVSLIRNLLLLIIFFSSICMTYFVAVCASHFNPRNIAIAIVLGISLPVLCATYVYLVPDVFPRTKRVPSVNVTRNANRHLCAIKKSKFNQGRPISSIPRRSTTPLLPGPTHLNSVLVHTALPILDTSSVGAAHKGVRSYTSYEGRQTYRAYDHNSEEETYSSSECAVAVHTKDAPDIAERILAEPEKTPNRPVESQGVSGDIGTPGEAGPVRKVHKGYKEVQSLAPSWANENVVKPEVRPPQAQVVAVSVDVGGKVDRGKEDSSHVSRKTEDRSPSKDTMDIRSRRNGVSYEVSLSPPDSGSTNQTCKKKVQGNDLILPQHHRLSLKRDHTREDFMQQDVTMPFSGHSGPRRSENVAFSADDKANYDCRAYLNSKRADSIKDNASETFYTTLGAVDSSEFATADMVGVAAIKDTLIEEPRQQSWREPTKPRKIASSSEHVQINCGDVEQCREERKRQAAAESHKEAELRGTGG